MRSRLSGRLAAALSAAVQYRCVLAGAAVLGLAACGGSAETSARGQEESPEDNSMKTIHGTVVYRERISLPPNAKLTITLEDVSRADARAEVISRLTAPAQGGPPFPFELEYDPSKIQERMRYSVRARIEAGGKLMFISTMTLSPFNREDPETALEVLVSRVGGRAPTPEATLENTRWKVTEIGGEPAELGAGKQEIHLTLTSGGNACGFSGCNQFNGRFRASDDKLAFNGVAATMRACMDGMEQERRFLDALGSVERFAISGDSLTLSDEDGKAVLRFEALYLK